MTEGSIVTFYSYKGGVGRTQALANVAALLSRWGYNVLCIDWDLEAPGLHHYFKPWLAKECHKGLTELIQDYADRKNPNWRKYITKVNFPKTKQPLSLLAAGLQNENYVPRVQALNWADLYDKHDLGNVLEDLRAKWKKTYDFILIDSRTGITDIGGICTAHLPDLLLLLFTANDQSLNGAVDVFRRAAQTRNGLPFDRAKLLALPIATRFEITVEYQLAQGWLKKFADVLAPVFADWAHKDIPISELLNFTRIPYIPFWSFGEKLPVIEKGTKDPQDLGYAFETLAALVAQKFAYNDTLVQSRDAYVKAAQSGPSSARIRMLKVANKMRPVELFISYSHQDEPFRKELERHLKLLGREYPLKILYGSQREAVPSSQAAINPRMEQADIILLLISADYLASDYVYDVEMKHALELNEKGKAIVIPVLVKPVTWQNSPISKLQVLPYNSMPVSNWNNHDEAWVQVTKGLHDVIAKRASLKR